MTVSKKVIPLEPFQQQFFFREFYNVTGKIYISIQLDKKLDLSLDDIKKNVILRLLEKEPLLRSRIYYSEEIQPCYVIHDISEFNGRILDELVETTDLEIDSKELFQKYTSDSFKANKNFATMANPHWKLVVNYKENYITFLYSHALFDGITGVNVLNLVLDFINDEKAKSSKSCTSDNKKGEILQVYPKNEKMFPLPPVYEIPDEQTPLFEIPNYKTDPWSSSTELNLITIHGQEKINKIINNCKQHNVSLNSYILSMLCIAFYEDKDIKCKFNAAISLRDRVYVNEALIPKNALGLMITFILVTTPKITAEVAEYNSTSQWEFIQTMHELITKNIALSLSDLKSFGNFAFTDQKQAWEDQVKAMKSVDGICPTHSFSFSNLSLNFKVNKKNHYNVVRTMFSQSKRAQDYFSGSMISNSGWLNLSYVYLDHNKVMENCYKRLKEYLERD